MNKEEILKHLKRIQRVLGEGEYPEWDANGIIWDAREIVKDLLEKLEQEEGGEHE